MSNETVSIAADVRTEFGKGAARRLRRDSKIPAVIYGHGSEATHITLPAHDTTMALRHHGKNALLELTIEGKKQLALTKAVQVDDIRRVIEHIDFVAVKAGEKVHAEIALHLVGEAQRNTIAVTEHQVVLVEADATNVPESIEVSIDGLAAGAIIHAKDLKLPAGVSLLTDAEALIVHVTESKAAAAEAPADAE